MPEHWTFLPSLPKGWTRSVGDTSRPDHELPIFLDGSGGQFNKDPRLRKCGWAWVQYSVPGVPFRNQVWGEYGALEGVQTVPRSETQALLAALVAAFHLGRHEAKE